MNYEARVAKGAAELDRILPGWEERIDLERLKLESDCNCVLGQLHVDLGNPLYSDSQYESVVLTVCPHDAYDQQHVWEVERGFVTGDDFNAVPPQGGWADLTEAWKRLIRQRLEA